MSRLRALNPKPGKISIDKGNSYYEAISLYSLLFPSRFWYCYYIIIIIWTLAKHCLWWWSCGKNCYKFFGPSPLSQSSLIPLPQILFNEPPRPSSIPWANSRVGEPDTDIEWTFWSWRRSKMKRERMMDAILYMNSKIMTWNRIIHIHGFDQNELWRIMEL